MRTINVMTALLFGTQLLLTACTTSSENKLDSTQALTTVTVTSTRTHTLDPVVPPATAPQSEPVQVNRDSIPAAGRVIQAAASDSYSFSRRSWQCGDSGCFIWSTFHYSPDFAICYQNGNLARMIEDPAYGVWGTDFVFPATSENPELCQDEHGQQTSVDAMAEIKTETTDAVPPGVKVQWANGVACTSNYNNLWCWRADGTGFRYQYPDKTLTKIFVN